MCDLDDVDRAQLWRVTTRQARKEHVCDCCGIKILPRATYSKVFAVDAGYVTDEKACGACHESIDAFGKAHRLTPFPSCFEEFLHECVVGDEEGEKWRPMLDALAERRREATP